MKKIIFTLLISLLTSSTFAQCTLPNNDFENWDTLTVNSILIDFPRDWTPLLSILNAAFSGVPPGIEKTSDNISGLNALRLYKDTAVSNNMLGGDVFSVFPCNNQNLTALQGYFKLENANTSDTATISYAATRYNTTTQITEGVGDSTLIFTTNQAAYKKFTLPIITSATPDTITIQIVYFPNSSDSTSFKVDSLSFTTGLVGLNEINAKDYIILSPNPVSNTIDMTFENTSVINIEVFNIQGQRVYSSPVQAKNKFNLNVSNFEAGVYIIHARGQNNSLNTKRFIKK